MNDLENNGHVADRVDPVKRATLTRLLTSSAVVAPVVASFAMNGMMVSKAFAQLSNASFILSNVTVFSPPPPGAG